MLDVRQDGVRKVMPAALVSILLVGLFWPTVETMLHHWSTIETYSHGFLILPISLWLAWRKRELLASLPQRPAPVALLFVFAAGLGWMLARLLGVQVLEQFAFVGLWVMALWAVLGHQLARALLFPLFFLFTMVPMGDSLVPPMMEFTADFTVWMLELTGIPVYREGLRFVVPTGNWSVVEACSGVRYLIASVTLGLLYAHLTYHSNWRKLLFVLVSIVAPILANGLRAYMIVMIGHLSDMKLAVGVDHLIYGWIFFGLVMLLLFWLGGFWMDKAPAGKAAIDPPSTSDGKPSSAIAVLAGVLLISVGLQSASASLGGESQVQAPLFALPASLSGWQQVEDGSTWPSAIPAADQLLEASYEKQGRRVTLRLGVFLRQRQGHEVISSDNMVLSDDARNWRVTGRGTLTLSGEQRPFYELSRQQGFLGGANLEQLHVTSWYRLGDQETSNDYLGKYYQGLNLLAGGRTDGVFVILATDQLPESRTVLQRFSDEALPQLWTAWNRYLQNDVQVD